MSSNRSWALELRLFGEWWAPWVLVMVGDEMHLRERWAVSEVGQVLVCLIG